ncbi:MAG: hypothetical protein ACI9U2_000787 [Bradymonadia bacterium]|jgi:hypothetical protein
MRCASILLLSLGLLSALAAPALAQDTYRSVDDQLADLKKEPSVQAAQKAALRFFKIDPDTVSGMRSGSQWKWVLPEIDVRYRVNDGTVDVERIDQQVQNDAFSFDDARSNVNEWVFQGSWALPRLIFNPETLDVSSLAVLQEKILKEVTRLYYTRRRLQVIMILNPPKDLASRISKELRVEQMTATIDAMTSNLFAKWAKRNARRRSPN